MIINTDEFIDAIYRTKPIQKFNWLEFDYDYYWL